MKQQILILITFFLISLDAQALQLNSASFDHLTKEIVVEVEYGGGCFEHKFKIEFSPICLQVFPPICSATISDLTKGDNCRALIRKELRFPMDRRGPMHLNLVSNQNSLSLQIPGTTQLEEFELFQGTFLKAMAIGGETTGFIVKTYEGKTFELVLSKKQLENLPPLGMSIEVEGKRILLNGVETKNRPGILVKELRVLE